MNTKAIAITVVFTALAIVLNPIFTRIGFNAPYAPFLIYQIWEIPIVAAFLLCGPKSGISVSILNTVVLLALFPGSLPTGPLYNLAAILSMLLGIYIPYMFSRRNNPQENKDPSLQSGIAFTVLSTALGIVFRVGIMTIINYSLLRYPPPVGYSLTDEAIIPMLPLVGFFNATLALYTIPIGYSIAKAISWNVRITS